MRVLNVALNPPRLGHQTAPDPEKQYSTRDYMQWVPSTGTAARQYTFVANFIGTTMLPVTNLGEQCVTHGGCVTVHSATLRGDCLRRERGLGPGREVHGNDTTSSA